MLSPKPALLRPSAAVPTTSAHTSRIKAPASGSQLARLGSKHCMECARLWRTMRTIFSTTATQIGFFKISFSIRYRFLRLILPSHRKAHLLIRSWLQVGGFQWLLVGSSRSRKG